jgi:hypothetical protein
LRAGCWQIGDDGSNACLQPRGWNLRRHTDGYDHGFDERRDHLLLDKWGADDQLDGVHQRDEDHGVVE